MATPSAQGARLPWTPWEPRDPAESCAPKHRAWCGSAPPHPSHKHPCEPLHTYSHSSSPTYIVFVSHSLCVSLPLSRFGLKHFFRNCIVNNVVLILESAMFPVFMGLMLLFIGPQCCIRPRPAPNYGSCVVRVSLALAWGHLRLLPLIFDKEMHFAWRSSFFSGLTPFPTFPLDSPAFDNADKWNFHWILFQKFSNLIIS